MPPRPPWTPCSTVTDPLVPREAVGDRNEQAHEVNLYDIDAKYGDIVSAEEVLRYLEEVAAVRAR